MSRFHIGQRVRLARPIHQCNLGKLGTIREFVTDYPAIVGGTINCYCNWDDGTMDGRRLEGFAGTGTHTDQLEPATDSYTVTKWSDCVWKPEHLRVEV